MGKLKIKCNSRKYVNFNKLAKCVYNELHQTAKLKAEIIFVDEQEIKRLNREFRNKDAVTDVLSFPTLDGIRDTVVNAADFPYDMEKGYVFIGSIAICVNRAREQAFEYNHSEKREFAYLAMHGLLHLMGYDHMTDEDKKQMRTHEKAICRAMGIAEDNE